MNEALIPNFYCPKCNKVASHSRPMFIRYSVRRLELIMFLCGECRLIYIDKPTIRRIISRWRKEGLWTKMSFNALCKEFLTELEGLVENHYNPLCGYKRARFKKEGQNEQ